MSDIFTVNNLCLWYNPTQQTLKDININIAEKAYRFNRSFGLRQIDIFKNVNRMNDLIPGAENYRRCAL